MKKSLLGLLAVVMTVLTVSAQDAELSSAWNSKDRAKSLAKLEKLMSKGAPACTLQSVQTLAANSAALAVEVMATNEVLPEMYKRTVGESIDGVADVTVEKPSLEELTVLSGTIAASAKTLAEISKAVPNMKEDVKNAAPADAIPAGKAVNFTTTAVSVLTSEIELQGKIIAYLIEQVKAGQNL